MKLALSIQTAEVEAPVHPSSSFDLDSTLPPSGSAFLCVYVRRFYFYGENKMQTYLSRTESTGLAGMHHRV